MKIVLLGSTGQVGWELRRSLAPLGEVIALQRDGLDGLCGDLTQVEALTNSLRKIKPDTIVNAAAFTEVDQAESEPELARTINADALIALANVTKELRAQLVHYSTDYVFDGSGDHRRKEDEPKGPLNVYGRTKLDGEIAVQEVGCRHLIFRTSWVYAVRGKNFLHTILRLAADRDALQVVNDQHGAPTGAELIADVTAHALVARSRNAAVNGIYHLAAGGETTWHGYARLVIEEARTAKWPVSVAEDAVAGISTEEFGAKAERPKNSRLDCSKLETALQLKMPDWGLGVQRALAEVLAFRN